MPTPAAVSSDTRYSLVFNSSNTGNQGTSVSGAGSLAITNSFGDSMIALVTLGNRLANSYAGTTTIYGGNVLANCQGTDNVVKFSPNNTLNLGGVITVALPTSGASTNVFGSNLNLIANSASAIATENITALSGSQINLTGASGAGTIIRNTGSTIAFTKFDTSGALHVGSNPAVVNGILGGWATYGLTGDIETTNNGSEYLLAVTDWATVNGSGNVAAVASYTSDTWAAGNNTTVTTSSAPASGSTTNSLRFVSIISTSGASLSQTISLAGANTISSGGILVTSSFSTVNSNNGLGAPQSVFTNGSDASNFTITGGTLTSGNGQDLIVNQFNTLANSSLTIAAQITGNIGLTLSGTTQALSGKGGFVVLTNSSNNYTGPTAIDGATILRIGTSPGQVIPATSALTLSGDSQLDLNGNSQSVGSLAGISYGTIVSTSVNSGVTLTVGNDNTSTTFNGQLRNGSGSLALTKVGSGTLTLGFVPAYLLSVGFTNSNYTGGTTINDGTISIMSDTSLGASGSVTINGTALAPSALQATGTFSSGRTISLGPTSGSGQGTFDVTGIYTLTLSGAIGNNGPSGTGTLVKIDTGTLALINPGDTYSGGTVITGGTVNINSDSVLGATTANPNITFNGSTASGGGTLQFASAYSGTSLSGSRNILVTSGNAGTVDTNGNNITWGGTLNVAASGSFAKVGAGSFEIDSAPSLGSNSALAVSGGTLRLNYSGSPTIGSGITATVSGAATLELAGGASQLSQSVNIVNNSSAASGLLDSSSTNQNVGAVTGTGNTVVNSGGALTAYQIRQNSLTINGTGKVTLLPSGSGSTSNPGNPNNINFSSNVTALNIAGAMNAWTGTLDIGNNGLVVAYGSGADPYTTIDNQIKSGFNGGVWGGTGITSSLAAAAIHAATPLNIGLVDFTPGLHGDATFIVFSGQTITTNAILVRLTYMDDLVLSGDMSQNNATSDALLFAANFGVGTTWAVGDLTHDGLIDSNDALLFAANYGVGLPSLDGTTGNAGTFGGGTAAVPEPASLVLAVLGGILGAGAIVHRSRRECRSSTRLKTSANVRLRYGPVVSVVIGVQRM